MVERVLLFFVENSVSENDIKEVEEALDLHGIGHVRCTDGCNGRFDAIIALGGDGTMLRASKTAYREGTPIISINFGTLGYMCGLEKSEIHMLGALKHPFETEERMLIDVSVVRNGETVAEATALNEAVVARRTDGAIAGIEFCCDGTAVCAYRADGVIIATPTGSSGYSMSAGGPIIDTKLDAFCVCPVCPHELGARAMVFSANSVLEVIDRNRESGNLLLTDGKTVCDLVPNDRVIIKKSKSTLKLIKLKKDAFYETLYRKMK